MSKKQLLIVEIFLMFILFFISSYLYLRDVPLFEGINSKIVDSFYTLRGERNVSKNIVIIDIDEKSLTSLGQWPWSRDVLSKILIRLRNAGVGIVGFDIVFAEEDRSSPSKIFQKYGYKGDKYPDYDELFSQELQVTPTVMGYVFDFKESVQKGKLPGLPFMLIQKNYTGEKLLPQAKGYVSNIKRVQNAALSSGFFNTIPDNDGIVRRVPLLVEYKDSIYPSLSLEIIRLIIGADKLFINYSDAGISTVGFSQLQIPTDRFGRMGVNYYGKAKAFHYISAVDIYEDHFDKELINGKIVLIGTSASGLLDLRATPFATAYPGVEIHASVLENILNNSFISYPSWIESFELLLILTFLVSIVILFNFFKALTNVLLFSSLMLCIFFLVYYLFVQEGVIINLFYPLSSAAVLYMILSSLHHFYESRQKELIKTKFVKKVSSSVVEELMKHADSESLDIQEREVTLFFSDIRGFTAISEKLADPKRVINFLNLYMTPMTEIILKNRGTVDKFIGDAIMAYWNAPLYIDNHADVALHTALKQLEVLTQLNATLKEKEFPSIEIGIGINSGRVVVGEMGSEGRSDYTIIGDNVNLGSRLEGLCKVYGVHIIISQFTKDLLQDSFHLRYLDTVRVKGKHKPVEIYEVLSRDIVDLKDYMRAISLYKKAYFNDALLIFDRLYDKNRLKLYDLYIKRCQYYLENNTKEFNPVFEYVIK